MALLQDLIQQIDDPALKERILQETNKLLKQKKFGLVFEEHLPECTPLYDVPIRVGSKVALKTGYVSDIYTVINIDGDDAQCDRRETHEQKTFKLDELVTVAEFGEAIYPTLKPIDAVENAPDSNLWHTLIQADNYHALQLLEYLYSEKVDCIYIDPPYNTGARDWKYNNDYVDGADAYRHSKWLSFIEKRLRIAKRLLNPETGVLIVTIDEHEVHHLRCLLEAIFPDFYIQMITCVTNPTGATQGRFSRIEEYIIYCFAKNASVDSYGDPMIGENVVTKTVRWKSLLRSGTSARREDRKNMFYPVYVDVSKGVVVDAGEALPYEQEPSFEDVNGLQVAWPIRTDGSYGRWSVGAETFRSLISKGYVQLGRYDAKRNTYGITYISNETQKMIEDGTVIITGKNEQTGVVNIEYAEEHSQAVRTVWYRTRHNAGVYGTNLISSIIGKSRPFPFPKSLYVVYDSIATVEKHNKDALIIDFFAGSGTTMHAVNLLNASDGGHRRCIMITNNEVSEAESKILESQGYKPGDEEWEKLGIARYVTWPRTVCSIEGHDINGNPLNGDYTDFEIPMSEGFESNAAFFKLSFLDKTAVALGRQFRELLPVLWMKGGAVGKCPALENDDLPNMLILPQNKMAVLVDEIYYSEFDAELSQHPEIQTVFIVTDSETAYRSMIRTYDGKDCYQLYRDYLDNFRINTGR
ncbi:MAG: DNA methyltransferase [Clostridiales bacterium]|nr:DNA methyltransferase [Clostridiales bacterium]MDY4111937.1 DNA methyltransferase [Roseburia sp.]